MEERIGQFGRGGFGEVECEGVGWGGVWGGELVRLKGLPDLFTRGGSWDWNRRVLLLGVGLAARVAGVNLPPPNCR